MNYTISPSTDKEYIVLTVKEKINGKEAMIQNLEAHALGKKMGINKYLVDVREAINTDTPLKSYDFAYNDMNSSEEIDKTARVAILVSPGDHSHDFNETVARNSGLNVTIFTDSDLAIQHLLNK